MTYSPTSAADIARAYRRAFRSNVAQLRGLAAETVLLGFRIPPGSDFDRKALREVRIPSSALVISVVHEGRTMLPHGDTILCADDALVAIVEGAAREQVLALCHAPAASDEPANS